MADALRKPACLRQHEEALYLAGTLPTEFSIPCISEGSLALSAPVVGLAYVRAPDKAAGFVVAWNVLGLLDLIDALGLGFFSRFALEIQPTSDLMTVLPLVLIPVYLVPLSIVLHIASLAKLRREAGATPGHGRVADARA